MGGDRIYFWAKYLNKFGYFPVVVTRQWNSNQSDLTDKIDSNVYTREAYDSHEVIRLPYNRTLRDRLNDHPNNKLLSIFRKTLSLAELILSNFFVRAIPYNNFLDEAVKLINTEQNYHCVIASGRPFQLFYIASVVKKMTGLNWVADYRDEWNTHYNRTPKSLLEKIVYKLEYHSEKKWVNSASAIISVSDHWTQKVSDFTGKKGFTVMNGYEPSDYIKLNNHTSTDSFVITYNGSLYASQPIEVFIAAAKKFIDTYAKRINIRVNFTGIAVMPDQQIRVQVLIEGYEQYFNLSKRIPKQEVISQQASSDLLLATGYNDVKGWYPVKIFEYYACGVPVLLCPSDNDVLAQFIHETNCGYVVKSVNDCYNLLCELASKKLEGIPQQLNVDEQNALKYTREFQTGQLAKALDDILAKQ